MTSRPLIVSCLLIAVLAALACAPGGDKGPSTNSPALMFVPEGRGTWIGMGRRGRDWDSTMSSLADAGINMVFNPV